MSETLKYPVHIRPVEHNSDKPFDGDLFERQELAVRLTGLVKRMKDGCVFAIDAPWGEGKTWFGRNWHSQLTRERFDTVWIDAFKRDYVDDPFLVLCSEILGIVSEEAGAKEKIAGAGLKVAKALIPAAAKAVLNFGGRVLLGSSDLSADLKSVGDDIEKSLVDATEKRMAKKLEELDTDKQSVDGFATALREYAEGKEQPIVIFIDELDRCRPDFAVKMIERIKHFFDVPGIVFVLLVNRPQLEAYVRGVYGSGVDSHAYLGKFVQFWLKLPKLMSVDTLQQDHNQIYCRNLAKRFGLDQNPGHREFQDAFACLSSLMGFSLRDLERGFTLFSLAQPINNAGSLAAWPIALKLSNPDVFGRILAGDRNAHFEAGKIATALVAKCDGLYILPIFEDLHRCHADGFKTRPSEDTRGYISSMGTWSVRMEGFLPWIFERVDLNVRN